MSRVVYIYALCEPGQPWNIRYVGKTVKLLEKRLAEHLAEGVMLRVRSHRVNWLASLYRREVLPVIRLLDVGNETTWDYLERFYIQSYRQAGFKLVNTTAGGESSAGTENPFYGRTHSVVVRDQLSLLASKKLGSKNPFYGKSHTVEAKTKIGLASKGRSVGLRRSEETRIKMSEARRVYWEKKRLERE